jgi:hypothetical protein
MTMPPPGCLTTTTPARVPSRSSRSATRKVVPPGRSGESGASVATYAATAEKRGGAGSAAIQKRVRRASAQAATRMSWSATRRDVHTSLTGQSGQGGHN